MIAKPKKKVAKKKTVAKTPAAKNKGGRPKGSGTVIDDDRRAKIISCLQYGLSRNKAAMFVGIGGSTLHDEVKRNQEFAEKVMAAEVSGELFHLKNIKEKSSANDSIKYLQSRYPKDYSPNREMIVDSKKEIIVTVTRAK